jgi:hypothetical protein
LPAFLFLLFFLALALPVATGARLLLRDEPAQPAAGPPASSAVEDSTVTPPPTPSGEANMVPAGAAAAPASPTEPAAGSRAASLAFAYAIDRSALPPLPYQELTLLVQVGRVDALDVRGDGAALDYDYDPESGIARITTSARQLDLALHNPQGNNSGDIRIAPLKDDYQWAWSHGFDDNVNLRPAIDLFRQRGWRATLFLIAREIDDERNEEWIADAPFLLELLDDGWSLGNHTWDHSCAEDSSGAATVTRAQERLEGLVARSGRPDYPLIAFAAPCFSPAYDEILVALQAAGDTSLLFNESGNNYYIAITPGAGEEADGARQIVPFAPELTIGRSPAIELGVEEAMQEFEWVAAQAAAGRPLWVNTFSHGGKEETIAAALDFLYSRYGPGGSGTLWVAPSDEIYSYLLLRDSVTITRRG